MTDSNRYSFPPFGAFYRKGDIRRGHRAVREGLVNLVSDTESYIDVLKAALEEFSNEERQSDHGIAVSSALDKTWTMMGVLKGALSLCPQELLIRSGSNQGE